MNEREAIEKIIEYLQGHIFCERCNHVCSVHRDEETHEKRIVLRAFCDRCNKYACRIEIPKLVCDLER